MRCWEWIEHDILPPAPEPEPKPVTAAPEGFKIFESVEFGQVRVVVGPDEEPWFVAKDVCEVLEINNSRQALSRLDDDEKDGVIINDTIGRQPQVQIVNESGLYHLTITSRKPFAKRFRSGLPPRLHLISVNTESTPRTMPLKNALNDPDRGIRVMTQQKEEWAENLITARHLLSHASLQGLRTALNFQDLRGGLRTIQPHQLIKSLIVGTQAVERLTSSRRGRLMGIMNDIDTHLAAPINSIYS